MTSPTGKTKVRRAIRKAQMGNKRKNDVRRTGTTPKFFTLDKPVAAEASTKAAAKKAAPAATAAPKKAAAPKEKAPAKKSETAAKAAAPKAAKKQ